MACLTVLILVYQYLTKIIRCQAARERALVVNTFKLAKSGQFTMGFCLNHTLNIWLKIKFRHYFMEDDIDRDISLAKNDIDRVISLAINDIDRDISLAKNDIDREGVFQRAERGFVIQKDT